MYHFLSSSFFLTIFCSIKPSRWQESPDYLVLMCTYIFCLYPESFVHTYSSSKSISVENVGSSKSRDKLCPASVTLPPGKSLLKTDLASGLIFPV